MTQTVSNGSSTPPGAPPLTPLESLAEVTLTAVYLVQKHQMASLDEIILLAQEKLGADIDKDMLTRALRGAGKRGLVATERRKVKGKGSQLVYSLKTLAWRQPPEYAHITEILPALHKNEVTDKAKAFFESLEVKGEKKRRRGNDIDDYATFRVTAITLDPLLGSQIACPYLDAIREKFPNELVEKGIEVDGLWQRDELNGDYILPPDVLQGWWATNLTRFAGLQDAKAGYVSFAPIRFPANTPVFQYVLPVNSAKSGPAAPKPYETIPAGQTFVMTFMTPLKGILTDAQIEKVLNAASLKPRRGISPARGRRFGRFLIKSFERLGALKTADVDMTHFLSDVPSEFLKEHGEYLQDAVKRLRGVDLSDVAKSVAYDDDEDDE